MIKLNEDDDSGWRTDSHGHHYHVNSETGKVDKGNPHVVDAVNKSFSDKKKSSTAESSKNASSVKSKVRQGKSPSEKAEELKAQTAERHKEHRKEAIQKLKDDVDPIGDFIAKLAKG